eukprot:643647-Rhodomonas_salina.1
MQFLVKRGRRSGSYSLPSFELSEKTCFASWKGAFRTLDCDLYPPCLVLGLALSGTRLDSLRSNQDPRAVLVATRLSVFVSFGVSPNTLSRACTTSFVDRMSGSVSSSPEDLGKEPERARGSDVDTKESQRATSEKEADSSSSAADRLEVLWETLEAAGSKPEKFSKQLISQLILTAPPGVQVPARTLLGFSNKTGHKFDAMADWVAFNKEILELYETARDEANSDSAGKSAALA